MTETPIRLLIVDDSALMRKRLREVFEADNGFQIAIARNGREALEQAAEFRPDVMTLDINMPELDGLSCLKALVASGSNTRVIMVSSLTQQGADVTLKALELGAFDFIPKPDGTVSLNIHRIGDILIDKVRAAARARPRRSLGLRQRVRTQRHEAEHRLRLGASQRHAASSGVYGLVIIGVSTGGPRTLEEILPHLPPDFPWPIVIAQHMPANFTGPFASRMNSICALNVQEVTGAVPLTAGNVYIGKGDADTVIKRRFGRLIADVEPSDDSPWHPSADRLAASALDALPAASLTGVLLTGMGVDGAAAMAAIHQRGGQTIAESESSAIVFGMPAELIRRGGAGLVLPADAIADQLIAWARQER